jgi:hypothetical protein
MQDLHWRYNFNTSKFEFIENDPRQHYEPLLRQVHVPTLVVDINLVPAADLVRYATDVLDQATAAQIRFQQIIFDGTQDPVTDYDAKTKLLDQFARKKGILIYLALSQFSLSTHAHLREINYPSWLFVFKKQSLPRWNQRERSHSFSCLNRNPSFHRLILYTKIKQRGLLDRFIYSFYDRCPYRGHPITARQYRGLADVVGQETAELCLQNLRDFPVSWAGENLGQNDHTIDHPAYQDAWCNIVTETSGVISFTSEKIWKPIAAGQLFLIAGAPGTLAWLRELGFHTFDDHYDLKINLASRFDLMVDVVERHQEDTRAWWHANRSHIEYNYHWFHSGNVEKSLLDPVISQLNHKY